MFLLLPKKLAIFFIFAILNPAWEKAISYHRNYDNLLNTDWIFANFSSFFPDSIIERNTNDRKKIKHTVKNMLKILICSTCNDFKEERNHIKKELNKVGYKVSISEQDDILFDPRLHTHKSCVKAVKKNDLVIFLIGNRYGGEAIEGVVDEEGLKLLENSPDNFYKLNKKVSITQGEILTAIKQKIPVYTFIRADVEKYHLLYENNKKTGFHEEFIFPGFKNIEHAKYVFEFYNYIRKREPGNFRKVFEYSNEIVNTMISQLMEYFAELFREAKSNRVSKDLISANVVSHDSNARQNYFDKFYLNVDVGDIVRVMGTGVTNFLSRKERIEGLLKDGITIELLLINDKIIKSNFQCSSDDFIKKIIPYLKDLKAYLPSEFKVHCSLNNTKFLIDTKHFNKYHKREGDTDYHQKIQESILTVQKYRKEFEAKKFKGKIVPRLFNSFVPLSITAIFNENVNDNDLIAEFILPFSESRIIFNSTKEENPKVYKLFMDFFTSTWFNSNEI